MLLFQFFVSFFVYILPGLMLIYIRSKQCLKNNLNVGIQTEPDMRICSPDIYRIASAPHVKGSVFMWRFWLLLAKVHNIHQL